MLLCLRGQIRENLLILLIDHAGLLTLIISLMGTHDLHIRYTDDYFVTSLANFLGNFLTKI
jgi:hypothetical protein